MPGMAWHVHHEQLLEPLTEPIENRIAYIKTHKPKGEQKLRLRLLKPVVGKLPPAVAKAWAAYDKAWAAFNAGAAYDKAGAPYDKTLKEHLPEIEALHREECPDCPWDGKTIFPKGGP